MVTAMNTSLSKSKVRYASVKCLWERPDISSKRKGHSFRAALHSVLLHGHEIWCLHAAVRRLEVFDYRILRQD